MKTKGFHTARHNISTAKWQARVTGHVRAVKWALGLCALYGGICIAVTIAGEIKDAVTLIYAAIVIVWSLENVYMLATFLTRTAADSDNASIMIGTSQGVLCRLWGKPLTTISINKIVSPILMMDNSIRWLL